MFRSIRSKPLTPSILAILFFALLSFNSIAQGIDTGPYFPLDSGNRWTYLVNDSSSYNEEVLSGTVLVNGVPTKVLEEVVQNGYKMYFTNDKNGILLHRMSGTMGTEGVWTVNLTGTFTPPFTFAAGSMALGETVSTSGSAAVELEGLGTYTLDYSGSSQVGAALETITVPLDTYETVRLSTSVALRGVIEGEAFEWRLDQVTWLAKDIGEVRNVDQETGKTEVLTATNVHVPVRPTPQSKSTAWLHLLFDN